MNAEKSKILVVFSRADVTHRLMLEGILRYAHDHCADRWQVILDQRDIYHRGEAELSRDKFTGIIAAVGTAADRRNYLRARLPTVLFEPLLAQPARARRPASVVTFFNDHKAEGRAAADYFLAQGYRSFAFVGTREDTPWSRERERGFSARLEKERLSARIYRAPRRSAGREPTHDLPSLEAWLGSLPANTAVFAAHDERALQVLAAAAGAGRSVPTDLAVLGVDDDELLCETASPALSSIPVDARETGGRFAEALHSLLEGRPVESVVRTCHTRVITRLSTDAFASENPIVFKALDHIRKHLGEPLNVRQLATAANCSRRTLEMRMRAETGDSPGETIARIRQAEAVKMLTETRLPVGEIASRCGYGTSSHLAACFRQRGLPTPRAVREGRITGRPQFRTASFITSGR